MTNKPDAALAAWATQAKIKRIVMIQGIDNSITFAMLVTEVSGVEIGTFKPDSPGAELIAHVMNTINASLGIPT